MKLRVKIKIEREIEVDMPAKSWENADKSQRLLFAKKQVEEEMFIKLHDYDEAAISYIPEFTVFDKYTETIDKQGNKKYKYEPQ